MIVTRSFSKFTNNCFRYQDGNIMILKGNEDLRVRRTIRSIKESFLALLNEQSYDSITVTGLASRAGISKKTFYYYYSSLDALLDEMKDELIDGFLDSIVDIDVKDFDKIVKQFITFFEDKEGFLYKLIVQNDGVVFGEAFMKRAGEKKVKAFSQINIDDCYKKKAVMYYTDTVLVGSYRLWTDNEGKVSVEKVVSTVKDVVLYGLSPYLKNITEGDA